MAFNFPNIDPVILQIGSSPFKITWYSLSYVVGILLAWSYIKLLNKDKIPGKTIDDLITYLIIGIIIGGRLGYVLFYDLSYYLSFPSNIIRTWDGGMSFHGGLLGVIIASFIFCKLKQLKFFEVMDLLACATPIGLFFGRIANFINGELYGRITDASWAVIFPGQTDPRHASQIYEALTEGLLSFIILYFLATKTKAREYTGMLSGIFLLLYSLFRSLIENFRQPDEQIGFVIYNITMGQILSTPMLITGIIIIIYSMRKA